MSGLGGNQGDGNERELVFNRLDQEDVERILSGEPAEGDDALAGLHALLGEIRDSSRVDVPASLAAIHVAAAASAAGDTAEPATGAARPGRRGGFFAGVTAKALAGVAMALTLVIGAAAAGWLPDALQSALANATDAVGIRLPRPGTTLPVTDASTTTTATGDSTPVVITSTTFGATTTSTTVDDEDDRGSLEPLVGAHTWTGTSCQGSNLEIRYSVTPAGTLELTSISDPQAEVDAENDRIDVDFPDGVSVGIELDDHGDEWALATDEDRSCDDEDEGDTDGEESEDEGHGGSGS